MEEWTRLCDNSAEATAAASMRMAAEMRMTAEDGGKSIVRDAYNEIKKVEDAYDNPAALGFKDAGGGDFDLTLAEAFRIALDIASGANNGANIVMLARRIKHIYQLTNEPESDENE